MKSLNQQLEQLKAENEHLRQQVGQGSGGFLSSIFGGGQRSAPAGGFSRPGQQPGYAPQPQQYAPQGGPWGGAPQQGGPWGGQPGYAQPGYAQPQAAAGGGFLRGALTTAAGVAGGMVVGNALMNAFSGGRHDTLGSLSNSDIASFGGPLGDAADGSGFSNAGTDSAGFDQGGFDQGGFDPGGDAPGFQDATFDPGLDGSDDDSSWT